MLAEIEEEDDIVWLSNIVAEALGLERNSMKIDVAIALMLDLMARKVAGQHHWWRQV